MYRKADKTPEDDEIFCRRVELSDLPKLKEMITEQSRKMFVFSDVEKLITDNPLSLCRVNSKGEILLFLSLSSRPVINCVAHELWTEWFNYFYDLSDVEEYNTAFVHLILFRREESLIHVPAMLYTIYVQMPDINNIILVKLPRAKLYAEMCLPFSVLPAKNVIADPEFGRPEIFYHTRATSIKRIRLRIAELNDYDDLRAALGNRLDVLDRFYGENCLADILRFPGENRVNLVPTIEANGLVIINTNVNYLLLDSVFDLRRYAGLIKLKDNNGTEFESIILRSPEISRTTENVQMSYSSIDENFNIDEQYEAMPFSYGEIKNLSSQSNSNIGQGSFSITVDSWSTNNIIPSVKGESNFQKLCGSGLIDIVKNFFKYQEKPLKNKNGTFYTNFLNESPLNMTDNRMNYRETAFMIELMLIDKDEEKKASWDYFVAYFQHFSEYAYCLMTLETIATLPLFKKFFCKVSLKPNRHYPMGQLYLIHRSFLFGKFTCVLVTKEHLEIMEHLIKNHPHKTLISDNISKSVFECSRYRTYIFRCDDQPIGYCVIRLNDEIKLLSSDFDVARYLYAELAQNHMADLLNMDIQEIFVKKTRYLLKYVMEDSNTNCLFYKFYSNSTLTKQHGIKDIDIRSSYITGVRELIPVKPRARIQNGDENVSNHCEKFSLFHMNTRLCTAQKMPIDAKIVVIGASTVALSFIENLVFNPVNHCTSFENVVLISDCGIPYRVRLSDLENYLIPKTAHFDYEYMKSVALHQFVDIITGTVTEINRINKCVTVNADRLIYYDYLFLFNGEQFKCNIDGKIKCDKEKNVNLSTYMFSIKSSNLNKALENVFLLNSENDIAYAFNYIKIMKGNDRDIVVYGKYLGSLSVINVLLESNIDGSRIVYVESNIKENLPFITSRPIVNKVYSELRKQGVRVYKQCDFEELEINKDHTKVLRVTFKSDTGPLTINCAGLFLFYQKSVNEVNRHTMIQSSFKFDGRVMVNTSFETNVEFVYAAGPAAKFVHNNRSFAASSHTCYSSVEIGARVADVLMDRLGVLVQDSRPNAKYVLPLFVHCRLPGGYNYLHVAVPCLRRASVELSAKILRTEHAVNGYFEMVVDDKGDVLKLSCYSKMNFEHLNLTNLCGKNVNLFNDMMTDQLNTNSIPCFYDYFREAWAYPLYSDRFWKLLDDTIMSRVKKNDKDTKKFLRDDVNALMSKYNANTVAMLSTRFRLDRRFDEVYGEELRKILIDFVDDNIGDFEVFSHVRDAVDLMNSYDE